MAIKDDPTVVNFLKPNGFQLVFNRLPFTTFYCQQVLVPDFTIADITTGTPFIKLNYSSTEVDVGRFIARFKVDENLKNYREILNWIKGLGFPETFDQYKDNKKAHGREALRSDASLIITTSSRIPNIEVKLVEAFPISLGGFEMETTSQDVEFVTATAVFSVRDVVLDTINECEPE
jgi:hypothetical protein